MISLNILHLSKTPLVGSPGKISWAINNFTKHRSTTLIENDYPLQSKISGFFTNDSTVVSGFVKNTQINKLVLNHIVNADIIHIHNQISEDMVTLLSNSINTKTKFIYQVHSPLREGPLFFDRTEWMGIDFNKKLVVAQHWPKIHQDYFPVPNIISYAPNSPGDTLIENSSIILSPTHKNKGKWTEKFSSTIHEQIKRLTGYGLNVYFPNEPIHPNILYEIRKNSFITIDDLQSGGWHQVTMEGLCAGNIVINGADAISRNSPCWFLGANSGIPSIYARENTFVDTIFSLIKNPNDIINQRKKSFQYYRDWFLPERLIEFYVKHYMETLQ